MTRSWPMKPLAEMTAAELVAALRRLAHVSPDDIALEKALRGRLALVLGEEPAARPEWSMA
ncbi:hypothetical protein HNR23_004351 [Nocardiopsis mwathae]|uniref:Uncharacterized protein n=1 Tax=Nocardiopsis mwathae TaxID=1472723 RepID=A0A7X0D810_9ACTN|nr:hypothetical protein [Nocardiopsis mwathae]MBB6174291.1 hypothetical protein [Nocardiopsis mwathae]